MDSLTPLHSYMDSSITNSRTIPLTPGENIHNSKEGGADSRYTPNDGEKLTGEVIDRKNNEITIKLADDTVITARVKEGTDVNIGDITSFSAHRTANGLFLEPLTTQAGNEETIIEKALVAAGLPKTVKNVAITSELLHNNMSIDKQSIINILTQSYANKDVSISTIVAMNKAGIPVTGDNARLMEEFQFGEHRIVNQISNVTQAIEDALRSTSSTDKLLKLNSTISEIITSTTTASGSDMGIYSGEPLLTSVFTSANDGESIINILNLFGNNEELTQKIADGTATLRETAIAINQAYEHATVNDTENYYLGTTFTTPLGNSLVTRARDLFVDPSIENVLESYSRMQLNNNELSSYMNDFGRATINAMIKGLPGSQVLGDMIWKGDVPSIELVKYLNNIMNFMTDEKSAALIKSNEYIKVLTQAITGEWTITPDELSEDKLHEKYKNMYEQLDKLDKALAQADSMRQAAQNLAADGKLATSSQALKNNLDFMNTLNEMFSYIQLPVRLQGKTIHSELYVMTNKKKLAMGGQSLSVLLHLDMDNLKPLDVNIRLTDNNVDAKFYMADETSRKLVETNMELLKNNLFEKGFIFDGKVYDQNENMDIAKKIIETDGPSAPMKRYAFDIRT